MQLLINGRQAKTRLYSFALDMQPLCDEYVAKIRAHEKGFKPTINGLAVHLGMSKDALEKYRVHPEFSECLREVLSELECWWEERLAEQNCTGAIFWLKNRGWTDKTQTEITGEMHVRNLTQEQLDQRIAQLMANVPMMQTIAPPSTEPLPGAAHPMERH